MHDIFVPIIYKLAGALVSIALYMSLLHLLAIPIGDEDLVPTERGLESAAEFFQRLLDVETFSGSEMEAVFRNFGITEDQVRRARAETPVHYAANLQTELVIKAHLACREGAVGQSALAEVITDGHGRCHVMLYPRFLDSTDLDRRANAWHELIHVLTGWSDQQVFTSLAPFGLRLTIPGTMDISHWAAKNLDQRHTRMKAYWAKRRKQSK
jgi:hypothetical protein